MAGQGPFNYQKSWTAQKPSSETHQWSFQRACEAAQADIETRWGVDYRITQINFADNGRTTNTSHKWTCERTWRCTHTVTCTYYIERRGSFHSLVEVERFTEELKVTYEMLNEFHANYVEKSSHEEIYETGPGMK